MNTTGHAYELLMFLNGCYVNVHLTYFQRNSFKEFFLGLQRTKYHGGHYQICNKYIQKTARN